MNRLFFLICHHFFFFCSAACKEKYLIFEFEDNFLVVLEREAAANSSSCILKDYGIPSERSADLLEPYVDSVDEEQATEVDLGDVPVSNLEIGFDGLLWAWSHWPAETKIKHFSADASFPWRQREMGSGRFDQGRLPSAINRWCPAPLHWWAIFFTWSESEILWVSDSLSEQSNPDLSKLASYCFHSWQCNYRPFFH